MGEALYAGLPVQGERRDGELERDVREVYSTEAG